MFPTEIQIVEVGDWAAWAGRILADLGFRVIHLEPPTGSRSRQGLLGPDPVRRRWVGAREAFFERGKESVAINWHTPTGLGLAREIVYTADILLDGTSNGFLSLVAAGTEAPPGPPPRVVRITPYGDFGPYRELYGHDLLVYALSGQLYISGQPRQEPVRPPGEQSLVLAGLEAALAALALIWDESTASAEVSALEALAEMEHLLGYLSYQGSVVGRQGSQHRGAVPGTVYRAR
ncbi:MAG: CoA transferase, partial [Firmicutes bacterium]|nr:CoA transferase [Bacillota bacterium]